MATKKKTEEELELAAHNRLKGTICYHMSSSRTQLRILNEKLNTYLIGCTDTEEKQRVNKVLLSLYQISSATDRLKAYLYAQLAIGESPSSGRNYKPRKSRKPYASS
jgi:hypothetical protein